MKVPTGGTLPETTKPVRGDSIELVARRSSLVARRSSLVARRSSLVLAASLLAPYSAAQVAVIANHSVVGNPLDLAISADESMAVVRTSNRDYFIDLQATGAPIVLTIPHSSNSLSGDEPLISKLVGVIEDRAIVGGYVDQSIGVVQPGIKTFQLNPPMELVQPPSIFLPGMVDVAVGHMPVTGDPIAAVRVDQLNLGGVHLYDMKTGEGIPGGFGFVNSPQLCSGGIGATEGLIHTLRVTSNRIIAITNQDEPHSTAGAGFVERGMVTIAHIGSQPAGWPKSHNFTACGTPLPNGYELVHDVATSPNNLIGVVSGTQVIGVYNLRTGAEIDVLQGPTLPTPNFVGPKNLITGASVAATNQRAVVIGNDHVHNGSQGPVIPGDPFSFRVAVLDLTQPAPIPNTVVTAAQLGIPTPARAHQVATTPNGSKAIVTTRAGTLVFDLTQPVAGTAPTVVGSTDPLGFTDSSFVADSVACTDSHAVVIGLGPSAQGQVEIIQLLSPTLTSTVIPIGTAGHFVPTDVVITPDGSKAIVRLRRHAGTSGNASRITVVNLATSSVLLDVETLGLSSFGSTAGVDHVVTGNTRAVTMGSGAIQVLQL